MRTRLVLKPGDKGTKKVVREYGGKLVCVRYRHDEANKRRLKTAEIILEEVPWDPGPAPGPPLAKLQILREERELQRLVKAAGGQWLPRQHLWEIDRETAQRLGLEARNASHR